jgi:thiol-disulfide isomerase/thioredoxin
VVRIPRMQCAAWAAIALLCLPMPLRAADTPKAPKPGEPTDPRAQKTFAEAIDWQRHGDKASAIESFRKANKQDGGHCSACLDKAYSLAMSIGDFKDAEEVGREWLQLAQTDSDKAKMHFRIGMALQKNGVYNKKEKCFAESCDEFKSSLALDPALALNHFLYGVSLAYMHQDQPARDEFSAYVKQDKSDTAYNERATRYLDRIELARSRMAPAFAATTIDGQHISMDSLAGKVVLIDFWATWCGPCREALPHIQKIAKKFEGQPFVVLSVSLDTDDQKWREFVGNNGMTWLQTRDGRFTGPIATLFSVNAIPSTFTIDTDGVLEDQHVGDGDIESKLKKLIARAAEVQSTQPKADRAVLPKPASSDKP